MLKDLCWSITIEYHNYGIENTVNSIKTLNMLKIYNETQLWKIHFKPEYFSQLYLSTPIASIVAETCNGRCNAALDNTKPCQCNSACVNYGDCCPDYQSLCTGKLFTFLKGILCKGARISFSSTIRKRQMVISSQCQQATN